MARAQEEVRMHTVCIDKSDNLLGEKGECVGEKGSGGCVDMEGTDLSGEDLEHCEH